MSVWYNDNEAFCCDVISANIARGRLPEGIVDERSIKDVGPADISGHAQCHFFAGIGGMAYGLRLAGWPDDLPLWTGGFPCQDVSVAGRGAGLAGERSGLWWEWARLIDACRPARLLVENVPALRTRGADDVLAWLEKRGYACWPLVVGGHDVGAPMWSRRVWILAEAVGERCGGRIESWAAEQVWQESDEEILRSVPHTWPPRPAAVDEIPIMADVLPGGLARRAVKLSAIGNAVVPQCVAAVARAIVAANCGALREVVTV